MINWCWGSETQSHSLKDEPPCKKNKTKQTQIMAGMLSTFNLSQLTRVLNYCMEAVRLWEDRTLNMGVSVNHLR